MPNVVNKGELHYTASVIHLNHFCILGTFLEDCLKDRNKKNDAAGCLLNTILCTFAYCLLGDYYCDD